MTVENLYHFLLQSYLNPVVFLVYLFGADSFLAFFKIHAFTSMGMNSQRLNAAVYLVLAPVMYCSWLVISCCFLSSFDANLSVYAMLSTDLHWFQYFGFLFTAFTLISFHSKDGMEANIMGIVFVPFLIGGAAIHGFFHFYWIWSVILVR